MCVCVSTAELESVESGRLFRCERRACVSSSSKARRLQTLTRCVCVCVWITRSLLLYPHLIYCSLSLWCVSGSAAAGPNPTVRISEPVQDDENTGTASRWAREFMTSSCCVWLADADSTSCPRRKFMGLDRDGPSSIAPDPERSQQPQHTPARLPDPVSPHATRTFS